MLPDVTVELRLLNCCKEMVLPGIRSGAKVGPTCGKALSRKELKGSEPLYLGHRIVAAPFIWWLGGQTPNLGSAGEIGNESKIRSDRNEIAAISRRRIRAPKDGIAACFVTAPAGSANRPALQCQRGLSQRS